MTNLSPFAAIMSSLGAAIGGPEEAILARLLIRENFDILVKGGNRAEVLDDEGCIRDEF
jgi:hypothetical protein